MLSGVCSRGVLRSVMLRGVTAWCCVVCIGVAWRGVSWRVVLCWRGWWRCVWRCGVVLRGAAWRDAAWCGLLCCKAACCVAAWLAALCVSTSNVVGFPSLVLCTSASQPSQSPTCLPAYTPTVALLCPPLCARVHACLPRVARHIQQARPLFQYAARDKPTGWRAWCCLPASRGDSPALRGRTVSSRGACARVRADVRTPASSANPGLPGGAQPFIGLW